MTTYTINEPPVATMRHDMVNVNARLDLALSLALSAQRMIGEPQQPQP